MELTKTKNSFYGPVPNDWITCQFQDVLTGFSSGMTPFRGIPEYYRGNIHWITSGELNYNTITDTYEKITQDAVIKTNLKVLPIGTFLMAITGLEAAGTRGSCGITGVKATTNQSCMALFPKEGKTDTKYLYHFYVMYGNELAFKFCQGSKQQSYTGRIAKILPINLPPTLTEQKAIATALSDADDLIANLEKLITKKKAIKQGAMQQLLTPPHKGGKRLAGFTGEWVEKKLGEYIRFQTGFPFSSEYFETKNISGIRLIKNRDLRSDDSIVYFLGDYSEEFIVENGELLIGMDGDFEPVLWKKGKALLNQRVGRIQKYREISIQYLSFALLNALKEIELRTGSTTVKHLSHSDIENLSMLLPSNNEQEAIAQILLDMDAEIEQLETKKAKYGYIKQGMMQELLTGKTRLV